MSAAGGARSYPAPAVMLERSQGVILAQWKELLRLRAKVLETSEIEAIHDLRVISRRFRAAAGLFEPWFSPKKAAQLKKSLRKLTRDLGGLRNLDEALLFFRLHTPAEPTGGYQICRLLSERRPEELARIEKALNSFEHRRAGLIVRKAAARLKAGGRADSRDDNLPAYFSDSCIRLFQPIHDLIPVATSREGRESRHALRIAIKKWRYFLEITGPVTGSDVSSTLALLKEYQSILGRMNDVAEFGVLCGRLALTRHERGFVETVLQAEDELLLRKLTGLIKQKPLAYTPLH